MMKRITKKIIDGGKYVRYVPYSGLQAYRKLGQLEDLMDKYNIDSVDELDKLLQTLKDNIIKEQIYNCENNTYGGEQFNILVNEDDGEDFKIVKKVLWKRGAR